MKIELAKLVCITSGLTDTSSNFQAFLTASLLGYNKVKLSIQACRNRGGGGGVGGLGEPPRFLLKLTFYPLKTIVKNKKIETKKKKKKNTN